MINQIAFEGNLVCTREYLKQYSYSLGTIAEARMASLCRIA